MAFVIYSKDFRQTFFQGIWYTPPIPGGRRIAGGKLTEKLRNTCRLLNHFEPTETVSEACSDDNGEYLQPFCNKLKLERHTRSHTVFAV
jgi:hypothetical protein